MASNRKISIRRETRAKQQSPTRRDILNYQLNNQLDPFPDAVIERLVSLMLANDYANNPRIAHVGNAAEVKIFEQTSKKDTYFSYKESVSINGIHYLLGFNYGD